MLELWVAGPRSAIFVADQSVPPSQYVGLGANTPVPWMTVSGEFTAFTSSATIWLYQFCGQLEKRTLDYPPNPNDSGEVIDIDNIQIWSTTPVCTRVPPSSTPKSSSVPYSKPVSSSPVSSAPVSSAPVSSVPASSSAPATCTKVINLVQNPSFETGNTDGWTMEGNQMSVVSGTAANGNYYVYVLLLHRLTDTDIHKGNPRPGQFTILLLSLPDSQRPRRGKYLLCLGGMANQERHGRRRALRIRSLGRSPGFSFICRQLSTAL